ncbi:MAG: hypothetical protein JSV89_03345 [Spirochaetaceae bacterium]|nr:MAG: hypothetical protein JSV89_03345 [Spirochaetaceae bacterium]
MRIVQADFRTVTIEKGTISCRLRYSLYQDGEIRYPESISCRGDTVVAYFLTSTIRDYIAENGHGFCIERHWNIVPEGNFGLSFCLEFPADAEMTYLFPGLNAGRVVPQTSHLAPGDRTCYANGLFLFREPESVLIFSDPTASLGEVGSIELRRLEYGGDADFVRVELRVPAASGVPSDKKRRRGIHDSRFFRSDGAFEYGLRLNLISAAPDQIRRYGISAVLARNRSRLHSPPRLSKPHPRNYIEGQIDECLKLFLVDDGPVCGLLETKEGNTLSSLAGCTLALIQLRYRPDDGDAVELSRRLADFSLRGQHPRGLFYPNYRKNRRSWLPPDSTISIPLSESVAIALMLLRIAVVLQSKSLAASAYLHAASHMADALMQGNQNLEDLSNLLYPDSLLSAGPTEDSPVLIPLFLELHRLTGKDVYRKMVRNLKSKFFPQEPQKLFSMDFNGEAASIDKIMLQAQTAVSLDESGYAVKGLQQYFDALLPWIYLNRPDVNSEFNPMGGVSRRLGNPTLLFRGFELSHTLLKLDACMKKSSRLENLNLLISQLLGFTLQKPMGTSRFDPQQRPNDRFGPPNSSIWVRELYYMTRLFAEFPAILTT